MNTKMVQLNEYLRFYREQRLSTIPIPYGKKEANIKWQVYQERLPTDAEIAEFFNKPTNIAVVCGKVSGNLIVLDCDSQEKFYELAAVIKEKTGVDDIRDFTLVAKSGRGLHIYLRTEDTIKTEKFPKLDIKGEGSYVLVPPSLHPNGTLYKFLNPDTPIALVDTLMDIGIDLEQKPLELPRNQPNWVTQALQGVSEGQRDDTCTKLAGYFLNKGIPPDVVKTMLYPFAEKCEQPPGKPFRNKDVDKTVDSVWRKESTKRNNPIGVLNNTNFNIPPDTANSLKSEQLKEQLGTSSPTKWGEFARKFDEIMREGGSDWQDKQDIAEQIGISHKDRAYRLLLQRRREDDKIRIHGRNPYLIQWVNRDYKVTQLSSAEKQTFLDIKLPLNLHKFAQIPPGSVVGVAGYVSSGKTSFLLETAELNALSQPMPVYYFYNEMSEAKMIIRCEDFPLLIQAQKQNKFFPVKQGNFEFADVIEPDGINLIDYLDRDDELYLIGSDIKHLQARLNTGIVIFALQKKHGEKFGYGGLPSAKLSNLYIALDTKSQDAKSMRGEAQVIKAKDWADSNPVGIYCSYHSGGNHGKLFIDSEWQRR